MQTYTQRVRDAILPLSIGDTLPKAFEEWHFTGKSEDHGEPCETCQLCGKDELRYHFEISNEFTNHSLLVGSHCILQFDVAIFEDGRRLTPAEAKKRLDKLTQKMRLDSCIKALQALSNSEPTNVLKNSLSYYRMHKKLTPKQAFVVFWRLQRNRIDHSPSFFSISLRKKRHMTDLEQMETSKVHFFWMALTSAQRKTAMELGHRPPGSGPLLIAGM